MKNKYYNDAIIWNKNLRATFSKKGELLRLYYPSIDFRQYIDEFNVGIKVNDSRLINLADDINNVYSQSYIEQTNILNTEIVNTYFNLKIVQTDCVSAKENILIKRYNLQRILITIKQKIYVVGYIYSKQFGISNIWKKVDGCIMAKLQIINLHVSV